MIDPESTDIGRVVYTDDGRRGKLMAYSFGRAKIELDDGDLLHTETCWCYWSRDFYLRNKKPETTGMNYSTAALLLNPKCRAIKVSYDIAADGKTPLDVKLRKTFDETIAEGDLVIVPTDTRYKFTVVKVVETDVEWEPDTTENVTWIVGKVDISGFEMMKAQEDEMITLVKESEKTDRRKKVQEKMFAHIDQSALNNLSLTKAAGNTTVIEHKPVADETKTS